MSDSGDDRGQSTPETSGESRPGEVLRSAGPQSESPLSLPSRARRRAWLAALAALVTVVGLGLPGSGCLNPRPEELPSAEDEPLAPVRETCEDNPLLVGCDLPEQDVNANPAPAPAAGDPQGGAEPDRAEPGATNVVDDDEAAPPPDAGTDPASGDAGAP